MHRKHILGFCWSNHIYFSALFWTESKLVLLFGGIDKLPTTKFPRNVSSCQLDLITYPLHFFKYALRISLISLENKYFNTFWQSLKFLFCASYAHNCPILILFESTTSILICTICINLSVRIFNYPFGCCEYLLHVFWIFLSFPDTIFLSCTFLIFGKRLYFSSFGSIWFNNYKVHLIFFKVLLLSFSVFSCAFIDSVHISSKQPILWFFDFFIQCAFTSTPLSLTPHSAVASFWRRRPDQATDWLFRR